MLRPVLFGLVPPGNCCGGRPGAESQTETEQPAAVGSTAGPAGPDAPPTLTMHTAVVILGCIPRSRSHIAANQPLPVAKHLSGVRVPVHIKTARGGFEPLSYDVWISAEADSRCPACSSQPMPAGSRAKVPSLRRSQSTGVMSTQTFCPTLSSSWTAGFSIVTFIDPSGVALLNARSS